MPMSRLASECYLAFCGGGTEREEAFLDRMAKRHAAPGSLEVLDVGCGPGRMLPAWARLGWTATGMEPDPDYHPAAQEVARSLGLPDVRAGGFAEIDDARAFDLIAAINDPFSHLLTPDERSGALARVTRALRPGGTFVMDVPNFLWILSNYREPAVRTARVAGADVTLTRRHDIDVHAAVFTTTDEYRVRSTNREVVLAKVSPYAMTSLPELREAVRGAGLTDVETYPGYEATEPGAVRGGRIVLTARRP
jgi:SAM-dependent methyltransferase